MNDEIKNKIQLEKWVESARANLSTLSHEIKKNQLKKGHEKTHELTDQTHDPIHEIEITS